jgi:hypothetical protein
MTGAADVGRLVEHYGLRHHDRDTSSNSAVSERQASRCFRRTSCSSLF